MTLVSSGAVSHDEIVVLAERKFAGLATGPIDPTAPARLFQEVREKRGLCYSIYAFTNNFQDTGFTGIYAGTGEKEAGELSAVIAGEMEAMIAGVSDAEM